MTEASLAKPPGRRPPSGAALAFAPGLLAIQERPPAPLARVILLALAALVGALIVWACFGKLDIIASAPGRLVPATYVKIVQPAEGGVVREILVHEGDHVHAGQVLVRLDHQDADADGVTIASALRQRELQIRRIDAELAGASLVRWKDDPDDAFRQVQAQLEGHEQAYRESIGQAEEALKRAQHDQLGGQQTLEKLKLTNPIYRSQATTYADLDRDGYVPRTEAQDKQRAYIENDQELKTQEARVASLAASVQEAQRQLDQLKAKARADLENERVEAEADRVKLSQDLRKQVHHASQLELTATESGTVKDIATHSLGAVVSPGTVLLSIVPENTPLVAEVTVRNEDIGFVRAGQPVKVKVASYAFQKYGLLDGTVKQVWPDSADEPANQRSHSDSDEEERAATDTSGGFKARIALLDQSLRWDDHVLALVPGMHVTVEINQGRRTVMQYLLSPIAKVSQESARER
jgi:HlyD family secretion protein